MFYFWVGFCFTGVGVYGFGVELLWTVLWGGSGTPNHMNLGSQRGEYDWDGFLLIGLLVAFVWVITPGYYFLIVFVQYVSVSYEASLGALYEAGYNVSFLLD